MGPHNSAIQIYDYKTKESRIKFGPELVMLGPDESFSVIRLSGDKPKRPNVIKSLCLMLGPDFMTDIITVETSDHARLQLTLRYNWQFEADKSSEKTSKIFNVRDFTGDACKAIASRVRGAVASVTFDHFHKNSAKIIRASVFGKMADGKIGEYFKFEANNLVITNVDIQSVEPVDAETRAALQKSVQMAITITTNSQEAAARHQAESEKSKKLLLELQAQSAAVESTGQAKAEALARAEAARIKGEAAVKEAELAAQAAELELQTLRARQAAEVEHQRALAELEINKAKQLADIEVQKVRRGYWGGNHRCNCKVRARNASQASARTWY